MNAEFEEKDYESPLNYQLLQGDYNLWTPGQVFEGSFGFDAALRVNRKDFWKMINFPIIMDGVTLGDFNFGYVWKKVKEKKDLPTFKLNLFLQTKRPEVLIRRTTVLKAEGLQTPYWRFEIKLHQQKLLSKLKSKLKNRAFVAYGCAVFHTRKDLYRHTNGKSLVQNSTFVKIEKLDGHKKWIYDKAGSTGIAMSKPVKINDKPLIDEIKQVAQNFSVQNDNFSDNLKFIANMILRSCEELRTENIIAAEVLKRNKNIKKLNVSKYSQQYLSVINFTNLTNTTWMVVK